MASSPTSSTAAVSSSLPPGGCIEVRAASASLWNPCLGAAWGARPRGARALEVARLRGWAASFGGLDVAGAAGPLAEGAAAALERALRGEVPPGDL